MTEPSNENHKIAWDPELPTERAPERAAEAARLAAKRLALAALEDVWCDSEAPTGVATERPILPRPPRNPRV